MTKTLLELARKATPGPWKQHLVDDTTVVAKDFDVCCTFPSGGLDDEVDFTATIEQHEINAAFIAAANPQRIIELCEALEGLIQKLDAVHADPKYMTVWQIAQLHQGPYDGPKYTDELARARRALNGE